MCAGRRDKDWEHDPPDWAPPSRAASRRAKEYDIYYSHSRQIAGTDVERQELAFLKKLGSVVNPLTMHEAINPNAAFEDAVLACRQVICSEFQGFIGAGVATDIPCSTSG